MSSAINPITDQVLLVAHRLKEIKLLLCREWLTLFLCLSSTSADNLEAISIIIALSSLANDGPLLTSGMTMFTNAKRLRRVAFTMVRVLSSNERNRQHLQPVSLPMALSPGVHLPWAQLTHISIGAPIPQKEYHNILLQCVSLISCTVSPSETAQAPIPPAIRMNTVSSLAVRISSTSSNVVPFLCPLVLPRLASIALVSPKSGIPWPHAGFSSSIGLVVA
ncbi:hypothetical protein Hypma_013781 [Hypsizygus marmoreus]|uniref:Uncharacterized protein n=1 Tax=Hypsizygus marmoreus TaxID=39966 RepID=A0A369K731_HYPMA|nr:hypothetical protein Hypma_013781 [Hypsizygus marmoreus]